MRILRFALATPLVVICTDCIGCRKSKYHADLTTTASAAYSELEQVQQYSKQYTDKREGLDKEDIDF